MANPRQRRKSRSGTAKVKQSKASMKNKHKVIIKGPEVLVENYDRKKTVRQNYALLGLMATLNPRQAGGIVPVEPTPFALANMTPNEVSDLLESDSNPSDSDSEEETGIEKSTIVIKDSNRKLGKGEGRIIRDELTGKILRIVMGGEDENDDEIITEVIERAERIDGEESSDEDESDSEDELNSNDVNKPWGESMEVWSGEESDEEADLGQDFGLVGPRSVGQGIPIGMGKGMGRRKVVAKTEVVRQLEKLEATQTRVVRHTSVLEGDWLMSLVEKYGDDVDKMARDRKANVWQKTSGEIKRAVTKAGGFSKLKAKIIRRDEEAAYEASSAAMEL